jgi:hypothetical protein
VDAVRRVGHFWTEVSASLADPEEPMFRGLVAALAVMVALPAVAGPRSRGDAEEPSTNAQPTRKGGGPLEVTRSFFRALHAGDAAKAAQLAAGDTKASLQAYVRLARAHRDLEAAVARRFGREEAGVVGYGNKVQAEVKSLLGASEEIEGDQARVTSMDGKILATLRRVGKAWKVELEDTVATPGGSARLARSAALTEAEARRVAAGIRAGRYADAETAVRDFQERVARASGAAQAEEEEGTAL